MCTLRWRRAGREEVAVAAANSWNTSEALARLKKKKALEMKLVGSRATASKLSDVLMAVDDANSNREAVAAIETGMPSLKAATEGSVTGDRVDAVGAGFDEMLADQQDLRHALGQLNQDPVGDQALLKQELEDLVSDEVRPPATVIEQPALTEEDEDLLRIMQELWISYDDAAKIQDPAKVAEADLEKQTSASSSSLADESAVAQAS